MKGITYKLNDSNLNVPYEGKNAENIGRSQGVISKLQGYCFYMHLWQRQNSSVVYGLNPICYPFPHQDIQRG